MKVHFPKSQPIIYQGTYLVRVDDINYGNHMGNERFLLVAQQVRCDYFRSLGYNELSIGEHTGIVLANAQIAYKREVLLNDFLTIDLAVVAISRCSFDFLYTVKRQEQIVAEVLTTIVCIDHESRKPRSIPKNFLSQLQKNK